MEISAYLNQKNLRQAQERDREKREQDLRIQHLISIKEDITKKGVPNYNAASVQGLHHRGPSKVPLKRTAGRGKEIPTDFDTHEIDAKMEQIEQALQLFENSKDERQHNIGYLPQTAPPAKPQPRSTLVDQRLSLLKRDFYLQMDQVAVGVHKNLKTKKRPNVPTDKYLRSEEPGSILSATD